MVSNLSPRKQVIEYVVEIERGIWVRKLPKIDKDVKILLDMIYAPMYTKILLAAIELDLFSELEENKTYNDVAVRLGLHPKNTSYLLDSLTAMGLLKKSDEFYDNTALSKKYLVRSQEMFIGEHLKVTCMTTGFEDIEIVKLVKEGPNSKCGNREENDVSELFGDYTELVKGAQKGGRATEIAALASSLPEFEGFRKMLDLGGGPGLLGMAVVKAHPVMKGVIFDTPEVGKTAEESIKEYNLGDRVKMMTGDYTVDSIGGEYDFIMAIGTLNFAKHDLDTVIKKIYDALNPKGVFMCISEGLTSEKTSPREMVVSWLPYFLKGRDFSLEQGEVSNSALRIGFRSIYKQTLDLLTGKMDVDIARK
ncbi:methyltransferase [Desulfosporosinus sp.]|uniref:methyltransferase n=1 Tax=Desulfosporosinus sp. TaxID=157907 RepID=UPI0025BB3A9B|nr:methyltransferase [Desulfosporosinus sp.]